MLLENFRASWAFLECFNEISKVFEKSVVFVWHSSQLPEQKEGLLFIRTPFIRTSRLKLSKINENIPKALKVGCS